MLIQHDDVTVDSLVHDGVKHRHLGNGVFEVPHEVGQALLAFPHWSFFKGSRPYEISASSDEKEPSEGRRRKTKAQEPSSDAAEAPDSDEKEPSEGK